MVMHRPGPAAILVALFPLAFPWVATAGTPESLAKARTFLEQKNGRAAVEILELSLPGEDSHKAELLGLLRRAYSEAAQQAESDGKTDEAELFRDNLEILNRKPQASSAPSPPAAEPEPQPAPVAPAPAEVEPKATPPEPLPPVEEKTTPQVGLAVDNSESKPAAPPAQKEPDPAPAPREPQPTKPVRPVSLPSNPVNQTEEAEALPAADSGVSVVAADTAFLSKQYDQAGKIYGALDAQRKLPKDRRDHWAYCRSVDVVRRINAKPKSTQEWESIDAEIRQIQALSPKNWFGDYLSSRAAERSGGRQTSRSNKLVVRGSAPEDAPVAAPTPVSAPPAQRARPAPAGEPNRAGGSHAGVPNWQVVQTANFRVFHVDPALASRVAQGAEAARELQLKRWSGAAPKAPWTPRCDIYIFPSAGVFSRMTGQPEDSPGFSTMGMNGGRIVTRRVNLRADHANIVAAILPHEVTHVVLADLFPHQQIPRWADEGMAVLSEPDSEQMLRAADLEKPLSTGQLFKTNDLMAMDYPDGKFWSLYYAQSVSLTRFLVEQGTHAQFVQFVQGAQRNGLEGELRRVYKIEGFEDLHTRWLDYARTKSAELTAEGGPASKGTSVRR